MGSAIAKAGILLLGYGYPAYTCFKNIESRHADSAHARNWCKYWIVVAVLCMIDPVLSWAPLYYEAKLLFMIYLWYPGTQGTTYVYDRVLRQLLYRQENKIDNTIIQVETKGGHALSKFLDKSSAYVEGAFKDLLTQSRKHE